MSAVPSFRSSVERARGYVPGEQPAAGEPVVKLNTNENPFGPPPEVLEAIRAAVGNELRLYPDPLATSVRRAVAARFGIPIEAVLVGNGSDELLTILLRAFVDPGDRVVHPWPTYSLYPVLTEIQGGTTVAVPYDRRWALPGEALVAADGRLTIVCNPNSPSGTWVAPEDLLDLARRLGGRPLVVDEAYADFAGDSVVRLLDRAHNLIVVRTLSKSYALAGLRVGYLVGHPALVAGLLKMKDSYNLDRLAIAGASAALAATTWMESTVAVVRGERERVGAALGELGFEVVPSAANFLLARIGEPRAKEIQQALKTRRILVRHFDAPELADALRITIGGRSENDQLLAALKEVVR